MGQESHDPHAKRAPRTQECLLLLGFLDFYGTFNYSATGISIYAGFFPRVPDNQAAIFVDDPLRPGSCPPYP